MNVQKKIFHHRLVVFSYSTESADKSGVLPEVGIGAGFAPCVQQGGKIAKSS